MKTPALRFSDIVDSSAARKRVNKVGAKTHSCYSPWLISKGSVVDPPIDAAPSWNAGIILTTVSGHRYLLSKVHKVDLSTVSKAFDRSMKTM